MGTCRKLVKFAPGTREAPRAWFMTLATTLRKEDWIQSKVDPSLFYWRDTDGSVIATMPLHVDDSKGRCPRSHLEALRAQMTRLFKIGKFEVLEVGMAKGFLGTTVTELKGGIRYDQTKFTERELKEIPISKARSKERNSTPRWGRRAGTRLIPAASMGMKRARLPAR